MLSNYLGFRPTTVFAASPLSDSVSFAIYLISHYWTVSTLAVAQVELLSFIPCVLVSDPHASSPKN